MPNLSFMPRSKRMVVSSKLGFPTTRQPFLPAYIMTMFQACIRHLGESLSEKRMRVVYTNGLTEGRHSKEAVVPVALPREYVTLGSQARDGGSTTTG